MPRNRFADLTTTRLELSDGDFIEVKNGLTYYEQEQISSALMKSIKPGDDEMGIDWAKHRMLRLEHWITDWSFRGHDGKPAKCSRTALMSLDAETAGEINEALDKHIEALEAAKKERALANGSG